jgi:hypothetical protein
MALRAVVAAILALLIGATAARGQEPIATLSAPTPVTAWGGHLVWSAHTERGFVLMARSDGRVSELPVAPRRLPFDADLGPDRDGHPAVVYSRCRREALSPLPPIRPSQLSAHAGCDIYKYRLGEAAERPVAEVNTIPSSETAPAIWNGRIAFARRDEWAGGPRGRLARVYMQVRAASKRVRRVPGGIIPWCGAGSGCEGLERATNAVIDMDAAGRRVVYTWLADGAVDSDGPAYEIRSARPGARRSLLLTARGFDGSEGECRGLAPASPTLADGEVFLIITQRGPDCRTPMRRHDPATGRLTGVAALPRGFRSFALQGAWAYLVGPQRQEAPYFLGQTGCFPALRCELVESALPRFRRPAGRYTPPTVARCWKLALKDKPRCA